MEGKNRSLHDAVASKLIGEIRGEKMKSPKKKKKTKKKYD